MKKVSHIALLTWFLLSVFGFPEAFSAGTFTVFGPKDYARTTGKPATMTDNFSELDRNASYALHIYNGGKSKQFKEKVSSAVISLNGVEVVRPNEFNQSVSHIQKSINLTTGNVLVVELRGKPDSGLTIEIIGLDDDPPTIVATLAPSRNAAGWNNTNATVSFACSDTTSGIASCPGPVLVQQEGANQVITGTATDIAGNTASTSITVNLDKTSPTIAKVLTPAPNAAGWNNTNVTVSFACSDTTSGIASCPGPVLVQQEGADQVITGTATDLAGNTASASVTVNIDKTPPVVTILSPLPGANLHDPTVTVQGTINETLSGVAAVTCNGTPATFSNSSFTCNVSLVEGENNLEIAATDLVGNIGSSNIMVAFVGPALELAYVDQFELVVGSNNYGGYYRPVVPLGFYSLGLYGQDDLGTPRGFVLAARGLEPGALARPVDYIGILPRSFPFSCNYQIWRPVPPPGYVCLGQLVEMGTMTQLFPLKVECLKPSINEMRCVREDLAVPAKAGNSIAMFPDDSYRVPTWQIIPADDNGIFVGTFTTGGRFIATDSCPPPPTDPLFTIDARRVKRHDLSGGGIEELVQLYGPELYFYWRYPGTTWYSLENYFPDDPEYVLNNGTTLVWGLVQNEWDYDTHSFTTLGSLDTSAAGLMEDVESFVKSSPFFCNPSFRYYLSFDDSLELGSLDRAKALVQVKPWNSVFTDLQFWLFYPFNGPGRAEVCMTGDQCVVNHWTQVGRHYGDWEQVTVRVDNRTKQLISVYMSRHGGGQWIHRNYFGQELQFNQWHPMIYVAKYSHANYQTAGVHDYERVYETHWVGGTQSVDLRDLTSGDGAVFSTSIPGKYRIISSVVPGYDVTEPGWVQFQGRWGQYERLSEAIYFGGPLYTWYEVGAGPTGPAMKRSWVYGDSGENWWWPPKPEGTEACFDGIDNDGDGEIDCHDPDCWKADLACIQNGWKACHEFPGLPCP